MHILAEGDAAALDRLIELPGEPLDALGAAETLLCAAGDALASLLRVIFSRPQNI